MYGLKHVRGNLFSQLLTICGQSAAQLSSQLEGSIWLQPTNERAVCVTWSVSANQRPGNLCSCPQSLSGHVDANMLWDSQCEMWVRSSVELRLNHTSLLLNIDWWNLEEPATGSTASVSCHQQPWLTLTQEKFVYSWIWVQTRLYCVKVKLMAVTFALLWKYQDQVSLW